MMGKASISLAHSGTIPQWTAARGKPPIPSNRLPMVMIFFTSLQGRCHIPGQVDHRLCGIHGRHNIGAGRGVQAKLLGNPRYLRGRQHQPTAKEHIFVPDHQSRDEDGGLQKSGKTKARHLLAPTVKSINISSRNTEHIQASNGDLDQQNAASLEVVG